MPTRDELPAPRTGFVLTHFLVVGDQDRSREWYRQVFDAQVLRARDPVMLRVANSWLILNDCDDPTEDKPGVSLGVPHDLESTSAFLNVRVADSAAVHRDWTAKGV